jgi:hypothetical protein
MTLSLIRPSRNLMRSPSWRHGGFAMAIVLGLVGAFSGPFAVAAECNIEAGGEAAYAKVQWILKKNFYRTPDLGLPPYDEVNIKLLPGCVFQLNGEFHAKEKGHINFKHFEAEFVRDVGAPMGFKKSKFVVSGG